MRFDIYDNEKKINTIIADENFCKNYCKLKKYTYSLAEINESETESIVLTREDEIDAILVDQEYRLTLLELGVNI